jgi:hypothetical protein
MGTPGNILLSEACEKRENMDTNSRDFEKNGEEKRQMIKME